MVALLVVTVVLAVAPAGGRPAVAAAGGGRARRRARAYVARAGGGRVLEQDHERPDQPRGGRCRGDRAPPGGRRGHRRAAARQPPARAQRPPTPNFVSHTTPLTVFAELGAIGLALYAGCSWAARVLIGGCRRDQALGLALGASLLGLFVHALFYSGFLEDPLTWLVLGVAAAYGVAPLAAERRPDGRARASTAAPTGCILGAVLFALVGDHAAGARLGPVALPPAERRPAGSARAARASGGRGVGPGHRPRARAFLAALLVRGPRRSCSRGAAGAAGAGPASRSCSPWRPAPARPPRCCSSACATRPRRGSSRTTRPTRSSWAATWCSTATTRTGTTTRSPGSSASTRATAACPSACGRGGGARHFAYFPGAVITAAAWGLLPEPFDDYRLFVLFATLALLPAALVFRGPLGWRLVLGAVLVCNPIASARRGSARTTRRACCCWCWPSRS